MGADIIRFIHYLLRALKLKIRGHVFEGNVPDIFESVNFHLIVNFENIAYTQPFNYANGSRAIDQDTQFLRNWKCILKRVLENQFMRS